MHDILTLQSMKENPYVARHTYVIVVEKEFLHVQYTNATIDEREPWVRDIPTLQSMKENPYSARYTNETIVILT